MKTVKYKTIKGLMKGLGLRYLYFNNFIDGSVWDNNRNLQVKFELSEQAKEQVFQMLAEKICCTRSAKAKYARLMMNYNGKRYGIFGRLWVEFKDNKIKATYCAGQDWTSETRTIQNILRR